MEQKMKKTLLVFIALMLVLAGSAWSADKIGPRLENQKIITGDEPLPDVPYYPSQPGLITDSPGEIVGGTQYDYQSNGSSGRRIAVDSQGGVHFAWMNGTAYPNNREVDYNYVDALGNWLVPEQGVTVSEQNGAGYTQIALTNDDMAAVAYHQWNVSPYSVIAVDNFPGMGIFNYWDIPDMLSLRCYWPYVAVDRNDRIHALVNEQAPNAGDPSAMGYTRSTDLGETWTTLARVDTLMTLNGIVVASQVSDRVAIIYANPLNFDTQWQNSVYYVESQDGITWDFQGGKIDVTEYGQTRDSLYAYADLDAIYDYNDDLHIVWNAQWVTDEGIYYKTFLLHFSTGSEVITEINSSDSLWISGCDYGVWNRPITKMSLGVDSGNNLYVAYTAFDTSDCSVGGYANGDIYYQYSTTHGGTWSAPENLTNSPSPRCNPGDCDSDHWSSLADVVDGSLHITYINDKDAGGIPQTEGTVTDNPVMYLNYEVATGIDEENKLPADFTLQQNYPNPFNAVTTIGITMEKAADVNLSIFNITGARVAVLLDGELDAGYHAVRWNAENEASGIYYYRLTSDEGTLTKRMALLK